MGLRIEKVKVKKSGGYMCQQEVSRREHMEHVEGYN